MQNLDKKLEALLNKLSKPQEALNPEQKEGIKPKQREKLIGRKSAFNL